MDRRCITCAIVEYSNKSIIHKCIVCRHLSMSRGGYGGWDASTTSGFLSGHRRRCPRWAPEATFSTGSGGGMAPPGHGRARLLRPPHVVARRLAVILIEEIQLPTHTGGALAPTVVDTDHHLLLLDPRPLWCTSAHQGSPRRPSRPVHGGHRHGRESTLFRRAPRLLANLDTRLHRTAKCIEERGKSFLPLLSPRRQNSSPLDLLQR
jgi:hypothetical protein